MASTTHSVSSPNGELQITVAQEGESVGYRVTHRGAGVVSGALGLELDRYSFVTEIEVAGASAVTGVLHDDEMAHGKRLINRATGNQIVIELANANGNTLEVVVRAYDGAAAFRYRLPGNPDDGVRTITREATSFDLAHDGLAWMQPTQPAGLHSPAYEALHADGIAIGASAPGPSWNMPALFHSGERWVLIAESDLDRDYCGAHLSSEPRGREYEIVMPNPEEGKGLGSSAPSSSLPWTLPWRIVQIADDVGAIVESNITEMLGRPCEVADPHWVAPGRVSWSWWSDVDSPQNLASLRSYVDFAAEMGWEHTLIDANWTLHPTDELRELIDYSNARGVGVFLWYNSGGPHNDVTEQPRDRMADRDTRRAEMATLAEWEVAGVKVDFFQSDKQQGIALIEDIVTDAADFELMVNLHGCTIPRGWTKRWPHLMTHEAVPGAEQYIFDPGYPEAAPANNTVLVFSRNVVGPMDYTPVTFSDQKYPHLTTAAHELALGVLFESPLQHFADSAGSYRSQDPAVVDILRSIPTIWDDTRFLGGAPGQSAILARLRLGVWYVAGINGSADDIDVEIPLAFLADASADALVIVDGEQQADVEVATSLVTGDSALEIVIAPRGGFVARLTTRN